MRLTEQYNLLEQRAYELSCDVCNFALGQEPVDEQRARMLSLAKRVVGDGQRLWKTSRRGIEPAVALMDLVRENLGAFWEGTMSGHDVVAAGGRELWKAYNRRNRVTGVLGRGVGRALDDVGLEGKDVLEIGCGVGGCTMHVLDGLRRAGSVTMSDVKDYFVEERVEEVGRGRGLVLDVNRDAGVRDAFDVIYWMNVMHVAKDLERSLRLCGEYVRPGGWIVMGEGAKYGEGVWPLDVAFCLFDGWWDIPRDEWRPEGGFLSVEGWMDALERFVGKGVGVEVYGDCLGGRTRSFGATYWVQVADG